MIHQITSQFLNAFLLFNAIGFGINFTWAFSQNIDLFSRSLFFSGFNLCILLSDVVYLSAIIVNTKLLAVCRKHQLKTLEEKNREDLEEHNKSLEKDSDDELVKELEELDEALEKDDDKNCTRNCNSKESEEDESEEHIKHNTENSNSDCDSDSSSEEIDQLKIRNFTTRIASLGVKQIDDVLSPEEYENLNFDSL